MEMPGVQHRNATGEIKIFTAFDIPHPAVLGTGGKDRVDLPHATGYGIATTLH